MIDSIAAASAYTDYLYNRIFLRGESEIHHRGACIIVIHNILFYPVY